MPDPFGSFDWICRHTPLPQCNLYFDQLYNRGAPFLPVLFPNNSTFFSTYNVTAQSSKDDTNVAAARLAAGTGVRANCEIPHVGHRGSDGDVATVVIAGLSVFLMFTLVFLAGRRRAAVGRIELTILMLMYALNCALECVTMSSMLEQGTTALAVLSAIHVAVIVTFFWLLLGNALISTQIVEDGTLSALIPLIGIAVLFFAPTLYISLDTALDFTGTFNFKASDVTDLKATALFILTLIWPALAAVCYGGIMLYVVMAVLRETKPALYYVAGLAMFAAAQVIFFLASEPLCKASNRKINGAFLTTLLDTGAMGMIYLAWMTITEEDWGDEYGMY